MATIVPRCSRQNVNEIALFRPFAIEACLRACILTARARHHSDAPACTCGLIDLPDRARSNRRPNR